MAQRSRHTPTPQLLIVRRAVGDPVRCAGPRTTYLARASEVLTAVAGTVGVRALDHQNVYVA